MSYAASLGQPVSSDSISVGARAHSDPVLARASLEAAELLLAAAHRAPAGRANYLRRAIGKKYGAKVRAAYVRKSSSATTDQQVYDAMRLVIADHYFKVGLRYIQKKVAEKYGDRFVPVPLGAVDEGQAIGCGVAGGATGILAIIGGAYSGGTATTPIAQVGVLAMTAAGCGAESQAAQTQLANSQATAAATQLEAARVAAAASAAASAASQQKTMITVAAIGGGLILLLGVGYMIVK